MKLFFSLLIRLNHTSKVMSAAQVDCYINYRSFHHPSMKSSFCKTLVNRAYNVCDKSDIDKKLDPVKSVLQQSSFLEEKISLTPFTANLSNATKQKFLRSVCIPSLSTTSHQIERILASSGIKVYLPTFTHKDRTDKNLKPKIYRIPCTCRKVYIGETSRSLKVRQKDLKNCCRKCQVNKSVWPSVLGKTTTLFNGMNHNFWRQCKTIF